MSAQIGIKPKAKKLVKGGIKAETIQTLENIKKSLNKYNYTTNDVVKCMVMLTDIGDFATFNEVYVDYFKPPYPARSVLALKELALGASVEVECVAIAQAQNNLHTD